MFFRFYDTSKQAIGALFIHFANVFLSTLTKEDPCSLWVHPQSEGWASAVSNVSLRTWFPLFAPSGIWWTSCWTPRWGCWSSGWLWSWCPSLWSTNSGLCSCLENMVREISAPLVILNGYMHPAALEGALNTLVADREESQHLQLQPSQKNIPGSVRGVFTVCQFLDSLCCCSFCNAKCFGLHLFSSHDQP